jgi:hypothetical protein
MNNLETIELDIDDSSELLFKVKVEGTEGQAKVRLVCESKDIDFMFVGSSLGHDDAIKFDVPSMKSKLKEGVYKSKVEVVVDNKYFVPVEFNINFKKTIQVVAESFQVVNKQEKKSEISVSAIPIVVKKEKQQEAVVEKKLEDKSKFVTLHEKFQNKNNQKGASDEELLTSIRKLFQQK